MSITVTNLCKSFGGRAVLEDFCLRADGPTVLTGPSGCGKTTLLRILMGLEAPDAGHFALPGAVAAVFQENRLCPQLTAEDNILLTGGGLARTRVQTALRELGFDAAALATPAARLSGGQKRRAALLRALLCKNAPVLLLDEPFTGMDEALVGRAAAAIRRAAAGRDCLLVTHDLSAAALLGWPVKRLCAADPNGKAPPQTSKS